MGFGLIGVNAIFDVRPSRVQEKIAGGIHTFSGAFRGTQKAAEAA
jgi:hypothetical protein